jgi:2-hydroxychromene-2-carboxylate isomerase
MMGFMWETPRKLDDPAVLAASINDAGLPADQLLARAQTPAIKDKLAAATQAAHDAGVFGIPTFKVGAELYFGKDQLREVEDEIIAQRA